MCAKIREIKNRAKITKKTDEKEKYPKLRGWMKMISILNC